MVHHNITMLCYAVKEKGSIPPDLLLDSLLIETFKSTSKKGNDNANLMQCLFLRVVMRQYVQKRFNLYLGKPVQCARIEYRIIILYHPGDDFRITFHQIISDLINEALICGAPGQLNSSSTAVSCA